MSSRGKRHLSPLATSGPSRQKGPRLNGRAGGVARTQRQPRVASLQCVPVEDDSPPFPFGDVRGISGFSSA